jgi:hypothetical protein
MKTLKFHPGMPTEKRVSVCAGGLAAAHTPIPYCVKIRIVKKTCIRFDFDLYYLMELAEFITQKLQSGEERAYRGKLSQEGSHDLFDKPLKGW